MEHNFCEKQQVEVLKIGNTIRGLNEHLYLWLLIEYVYIHIYNSIRDYRDMSKKKRFILIILMVLLCVCAHNYFNEKKTIKSASTNADDLYSEKGLWGEYVPTIETDMSAYTSLNETQKSVFKEINLESLEDILENKKTAIIYFGYAGCDNCQNAVLLLSDLALQRQLTIYYLDAQKMVTTSDETVIKGINLLSPVLEEREDMEGKAILCPEVIKIIEGNYVDYAIGIDGIERYEELLDIK